MKLPRIMLAAPASGSGKTLITCGILQALKNRGLSPASFKCGPDYIDPMFHEKVLGVSSGNLDTFFTDEETTGYLFARAAKEADFSVIEGVMGYYDGLAGTSLTASAYDVAGTVKAPVVLVVNTKGMSLSVTALIQGFLQYQKDSHIAGVILNRMSGGLYPRIKTQIESELPVKVLGYVPNVSEGVLESRHLGLVTPDEVEDLRERLEAFSRILETTVDLDALLKLGNEAPELYVKEPKLPDFHTKVRVGIARDEAFCFHYRDNLELLQRFGAELVPFSPVHDESLPEDLDGMILYGGYPELYAKQLSANAGMTESIRKKISQGMPYLAECGGFMYLHDFMEDMAGESYPVAGIIPGKAYRTPRLGRFGYITLETEKDALPGEKGTACRGHEFHYFDSTNNGEAFLAKKPLSDRSWQCIHATKRSMAGFPHIYYYSNPGLAVNFLKACEMYKKE
ncbi:MAG: cobyrinate a,c-diamide synthase [Lachnospiraceae bacterium]